MSERNVEVIRAMWEPFAGLDAAQINWDAKAIREMIGQPYSPEVELRWSATGPDSRVYRGRDGVIEAFNVYAFRDGEITKVDEYETFEEALEAAGLGE
jgi:hypothetical protein